MNVQKVVIMKKGNEVARMISKDMTVSFLSDNFVGVLSSNVDDKKLREERVARYEDAVQALVRKE